MNIAFDDMAMLGSMSKNRGIGNYALSQFRKMIERDRNNQYFFLNLLEEFSLSDFVDHAENLHEFYFYTGKDNYLLMDPCYSAVIGDVIQNFIQEHQIDVFYITSPFEGRSPLYQREWFAHTKVVATVYDIIPYLMKEHYLANASAYQFYMKRIEMLRWVDRCLVISNSVKNDLLEHLQFEPDKIDVIYGAADECYCNIVVSENEKDALFQRYAIESSYIMCTGGDDERKNLEGLILAYALLPEQLIDQYQLVIVCKLTESSFNRYTKLIEKKRLTGRVILTNFIPNEDLIVLYNLAYLLAFPSKYEGFGLPIVEAWACGTPVLTSNNSSLGEIAGDAAVQVDPFSVEDVARGLIEALTNTDLSALRNKGMERLKHFQWDVVADLTISFLEKEHLLQKEEAPSPKLERKKARLAFFTPLPPVKSGISDYSVDILNAISDSFEIDVFIDDGYQPDRLLDRSIHVYHHREFRVDRYDYVLFQVGNSEYHSYMFPYIAKYGGIVVLHDYNLHSVAHYESSRRKNSGLSLYREFLLTDYPVGYVTEYLQKLKSGKSGVRVFEIEVNGFVVNYANKIIVHSDEAKAKLLQRNIGRNVKKIHSYAKIEPLKDSDIAKTELGIPKDQVVLASFGHIQKTKRTIPTIKAFHRLCKKYKNAHFYFVGSPDLTVRDELYQYIKDNQLENNVTITGYVGLDEFARYIDATDICVNLRYPSNGETSGSLMRTLAKGKCVMVNDIGSFREIPDECCVKLPSPESMVERQEVELIYQAFERLLSEKDYWMEISANARAYAEQYLDLDRIAGQYVSYIQDNRNPALTEDMLVKLKNEIQAQNYTISQIQQLGHTLGYSKNCQSNIREELTKIPVKNA